MHKVPRRSRTLRHSWRGAKCLPKLITWSQHFIAIPRKLDPCDIRLFAWKRRRGDLELLHEGFRSVSAHGKLVEEVGLYEFSPFIPSHLRAQVYGSGIVKMLRRDTVAALDGICLSGQRKASHTSDGGGSPGPGVSSSALSTHAYSSSCSGEPSRPRPPCLSSPTPCHPSPTMTSIPHHVSVSAHYQHLLLSRTACLPPGSAVGWK